MSYVRDIRKKISTLDIFSKRYPLVSQQIFKSRNIRKMVIKNFYVYYLVNDMRLIVYVINIIYCKQNQKYAFEKMHID